MALPARFQIIENLDTPIKSTFYFRKQPHRDWKRCGFGWNNTAKSWLEAYPEIQFAKKTTRPRFKSARKFPFGY